MILDCYGAECLQTAAIVYIYKCVNVILIDAYLFVCCHAWA